MKTKQIKNLQGGTKAMLREKYVETPILAK